MNFSKEERILIVVAIVIIAVLVGYNAFYVASPSQETLVYTDNGSYGDEEYIANDTNSKININTATLAELSTLNNIGSVTAQKIIDYRESNGPFTEISELMNVDGIGQSTFDDVKNNITI